MGRKLAVSLVAILIFAAAGAAFVLLSGDDDASDTAQGTTTTAATSSTAASSTRAPTTAPSTTASATTAPTSTAVTTPSVGDCGAEGGAILAAVNNGVAGASDKAQVDECRRAGDPTYAGVRLVAKPGADFDATTVVLHGGGGSWAIVGSGDNVCSETPQLVLVDLGIQCASGGGAGR